MAKNREVLIVPPADWGDVDVDAIVDELCEAGIKATIDSGEGDPQVPHGGYVMLVVSPQVVTPWSIWRRIKVIAVVARKADAHFIMAAPTAVVNCIKRELGCR